jgi:membrane-bound serine protease (ClpP class)
VRRLAMAILVLGAVAAGPAMAVASADVSGSAVAPVDVFEVSGFLDAPVADGLEQAIGRTEHDGAQALVLQMNSSDATVSRRRMVALASRIRESAVPVAIWVGPSGARAEGLAGQLLGVAVVTGMAPGAGIGHFGDLLTVPGPPLSFGTATERLRFSALGAEEARAAGALRLGVNDAGTPVLRNFIGVLDGVRYRGTTLHTLGAGPDGRPTIVAQPQFSKLGLLPRLMHTVASPPVAYLLVVAGLCLLVFEFFTAGVGVAGVIGAGCLVLGCYGLAALPVHWWAVALLIGSILALAIDVQTGVPRFWTVVGVVAFVLASVLLYDGLHLSWITLLAGIGGVLLAFLAGLPAMVRARFATPTIGRQWMVGETGEAVVAVEPDGIVNVRGAQWRARTNRATPVPAGGRVRVVAIDGVTLEVEPESGGAREHRPRRTTA